MVWLNGSLVPADEARVSVWDHGLTTGDGVFEAVKVTGGVPFALTRHLARLRASAAGLGLPEPDLVQIRAGVTAVLAAAGWPDRARIRITVTAGESVLGSARPDGLATAGLTTVIVLGELAGAAASCDVAVLPWPRNERGLLAGVKTTSYAENVRALAYARERGAAEAIFGNLAGNLCEGTGTNVFLVTGGRLVTPPLSAGLPGRGHPGAGRRVGRGGGGGSAAVGAGQRGGGVPDRDDPRCPADPAGGWGAAACRARPGHPQGGGDLRRAFRRVPGSVGMRVSGGGAGLPVRRPG